jgi:hypothetical protein
MMLAIHFQALLDAASRWLDAGFSLIPVSQQTKAPREDLLPLNPQTGRGTWKPFQERQPTADEVRYWIEHDADLALVCGFGGLLVIDIDEPRLYAPWRSAVGTLAQDLATQTTASGKPHLLLRCDEPGQRQIPTCVPDATRPDGRRIGIEVRGWGCTAKLYDLGLNPATIPHIDTAHVDALIAAMRKLDEAPWTKTQLEAMQRAMQADSRYRTVLNGSSNAIDAYNKAVDIHAALQSYGYTTLYGNHYLHPGSTQAQANVSVQGHKSFHWSPNDPLFCNGKGHDAFDLFCFFEHGGDPKAAAKAAATQLCLPPLTHTVAASAAPSTPAASAQSVQPPSTPRWRALTDLLKQTFPEPTWIIPDLLSAGVTILAGRPKRAKKSWLMLDLARAVAGDGQTLGSLDVAHGDVLYLALEDSDRRLQSRFEKLLAGDAPPTQHAFDYATEWERFEPGTTGLPMLELWLQTHPAARLVVIDTLAKVRAASKPGSVYEQDYAALQGVMSLAKKYTDVAFVIVHHTRKSGADDALEEISGSFGLTGGVDDIWVIRRVGEDATLSAIGRNLPREKDVALVWHEETARWSVAGDAQTFHRSKQRQVILDALIEAEPDGMTPRELSELTGEPSANIRMLLSKMTRDGQVVKRAYGRYAVVDAVALEAEHAANDDDDDDDGPTLPEQQPLPEPEPVPAAPQVMNLTSVWQEVPEGWAVPAGADITMNMEQGKTYVRLMPSTAPPDTGPSSHDQARVYEIKQLARQRKFNSARKTALTIRNRGLQLRATDWISRVERGDLEPDEGL